MQSINLLIKINNCNQNIGEKYCNANLFHNRLTLNRAESVHKHKLGGIFNPQQGFHWSDTEMWPPQT